MTWIAAVTRGIGGHQVAEECRKMLNNLFSSHSLLTYLDVCWMYVGWIWMEQWQQCFDLMLFARRTTWIRISEVRANISTLMFQNLESH